MARRSMLPHFRLETCAAQRMLRTDRGFTLIELMTVLVISGIVTALAAPSFAGWVQSSRLDGALGQVRSDLAYARMLAVRSNSTLTVTFGPNEYIITRAGQEAPLKTTRVTSSYPGLTLTASPAAIQFDSRGLMRTGNGVIEATAAGSGRRGELRINATGRVRRVH